MTPRISCVVIATIFLCACGDSSKDQAMSAGPGPTALPTGEMASNSGDYDRKSFVLCPALESHREELAAIVGFEQDSDRALSMSATSRKCSIRGKGGDYIGVEIPPAMISSIERHATESFGGTASPAPELGDDAMYVDNISKPRVIFSMGPILIDVHADYTITPDRKTMVALGTRVRDILGEAN